MPAGKFPCENFLGGCRLSIVRWRTASLVTCTWLLLLCLLTGKVFGGERSAGTEALNFMLEAGVTGGQTPGAGLGSACEHGRFGASCEFKCQGGDGGFCTDEGIICFLGEFLFFEGGDVT